ncbi:MAG TPA: DUF6265 family protein [Bryobacteraceae bacterium]|nr:DUF6265 family protein [Bryobacteraceae bacterium]
MRVLLFLCGTALCAGQIDKLAFMAGCWAGPGTYEMWMKPEAGSVMGMGRSVRNGKVVGTEYFSVSEQADGIVLNVQQRLAAKTTAFRVKEITATSVVFENPEHDFPQRVIYRLTGPDALLGRIEGLDKGKDRAIDYPMQRARCNND